MNRKPTSSEAPANRRQRATAELRDLKAQREDRPMMAELYRRAKARLRKQTNARQTKAEAPKLVPRPQRLLHELEIHQIELELQNAELRKTRDELEKSLEQYLDLYDFAPVGYFTLTANGRVRLANLTGASLVGIERARLVGQPFEHCVTAAARPGFVTFLEKVFAGPTKHTGEFALFSPRQPSRIVSLEAKRLLNGLECRVVLVDITQRKQAEDLVRLSEIRYRRLFEAAHDGVLVLDPGTCKITDANPYMTKLLGYRRDQLVGKELFEIGLLRDQAASREMFQKLRQSHEVRYEDLPLESQDGRHQEVEVVANLYVENGHPVIQCNVRDITERKQAEEMLRRNEAIFSALVAQSPAGVYVVDAQLKLRQLNPLARLAFGKVRPSLGRSLSEVLYLVWPRRVADRVLERFRHTLTTGETYQSPDFTERRRDSGRSEVYEWQLQRITLPAGEQGVVCFFNNITERKRAEGAQRRLDIMTATNLKLKRAIVHGQAVERTLRQSQEEQGRLLSEARFMQRQLQQLSHQILHAQEEERKRISRELHDEIAQSLVGINVHLAALNREGATHPSRLRPLIARTCRLVEKSVEIVHRFAWELRPTALDDLGLMPTLQTFMKAFTKRTGVRARLTAFAAIEKLEMDQRTVLYRVAHEALNNVAQHARASHVEVTIEKLPDRICMKIKDDGKAFDVDRVGGAKGRHRMGLLGMRERLEMVGGNFKVDSVSGTGTTVHAQIPDRPHRGGRK